MKTALLSCLLLASAIRQALAACTGSTSVNIQPTTTITSDTTSWEIIANQKPRFSFPTFSDTISGCPVVSYSACSDNACSTLHPLLTAGIDSDTMGQVWVVPTGSWYVDYALSFYLKVEVEGGQWALATTSGGVSLFNLNSACGVNSVTFNLTIYPTPYTNTQFAAPAGDTTTTGMVFNFPYLNSSVEALDPATSCVVDNDFTIVGDDETTTTLDDTFSQTGLVLTVENKAGSSGVTQERYLKVAGATLDSGSYIFKLKFKAVGGNYVYTSRFYLNIDTECNESTMTAIDNDFYSYVYNWGTGANTTLSNMQTFIDVTSPPVTYTLPGLPAPPKSILNEHCQQTPTSYAFGSQYITEKDGTQTPVAYLEIDSATGVVTAKQIDFLYRVSFTIKIRFQDGAVSDVYYTSPTNYFQVNCTDAQIVVHPPADMSYTFSFIQGTSSNKFTWGNYWCSEPKCCGDMFHFVASDPTYVNNDKNFDLPTIWVNEVEVDETSTGVFKMYLFTSDMINLLPIYDLITITVIDKCKADTFHILASGMTDGQNVTITDGLAYVEQQPTNSSFQQIRVWVDRDASGVIQIDLSSRFEQTNTACSITDYSVSDTKALISGTVMTSSQINQAFITYPNGRLQFSKSPPVQFVNSETYELTIQTTNGIANSAFTQALVVVQYFSSKEGPAVPATPPYFLDPVTTNYTFNVTALKTSSEDIVFPETFDPNVVDTLSLTIASLDTDRFTFANASRTLTVNFDQFNSTETVTMTLRLEDSTGLFIEVDFSVNVIKESPAVVDASDGGDGPDVDGEGPEVETEKKPWWNPYFPDGFNFTVKEDMRVVQFWIQSFSRYGELVLGFNDTGFGAIDPAKLNLTTMDIYIVPTPARLKEESFELKHVNFTWESPELTSDDDERTATFTLKFLYPVLISPLEIPDRLVIHFKERYYPLDNEPIGFIIGNHTLKLKARKQIENTPLTKNFESGVQAAEGGMISLLVISFLLQILLTGGMQYLVVFIRSLQLILHLPLLNVIVPTNVLIMFSSTMSIAMFDVLDPAWTTELVLDFDDDAQDEMAEDIPSQWQEMGYENYNSIQNLGSLSVFLAYQFFKMMVYFTAKAFSYYDKKAEAYVKIIRQGLFFGGILSLLVDAYFEFLISGYLVTLKPLFTMSGETLSVFIGYTGFFTAVFFLPISLGWVMLNPVDHTKEDEFLERWGSLYEDLKYHSKLTQSYYLAFAARRVIYVCILFFAKQHPQLQIQALLFLHLFSGMYIGWVQAHQEKLIVYIELINEFFIQSATLHMSMFYMLAIFDEPGKATVGWYLIIWVSIFIIINLYFILKSAGWQIFLVAKRYWNMLKRSQKLKKYAQKTDQTLAKKLKQSLADFELTFKELQETENVLGSCYSESRETENEECNSDIDLTLKPMKKKDPRMLQHHMKQDSSSSSRSSDKPLIKKKTAKRREGNPTWITPTQPGASNDSNDTFSFRDRSIIESSQREGSNSRSPRTHSPRSPRKSPSSPDRLSRIPEANQKIKKQRSGGSRKKSKPKKKLSRKKKSTTELDSGSATPTDEPMIKKSHPNSNPGSKKTLNSEDHRIPSGGSSRKRKSKQPRKPSPEEEKDPYEAMRLKRPPPAPASSLFESNKSKMNPFPQRQIVDLSGYEAPDRSQGDVLAAGCDVDDQDSHAPSEWRSKQQTKGSGWRQVLADMEDNERKTIKKVPGQQKESDTSHTSLFPQQNDYQSMFDTWNNKSRLESDESDGPPRVNSKPKGSAEQSKLNSGTSLQSVNPFRGLHREESKEETLPPRGRQPRRQVERPLGNGGRDASPDHDSSEERDAPKSKLPDGLTLPMDSTFPMAKRPGQMNKLKQPSTNNPSATNPSTTGLPSSSAIPSSTAHPSSGMQPSTAADSAKNPKLPYSAKPQGQTSSAKPPQQDDFNPFDEGANDDEESGLGVTNEKPGGVILNRSREGDDGTGLLYSFKKKTPFTDFVTVTNKRFQKSNSPPKERPAEQVQKAPSFKKRRSSKAKSGSPKSRTGSPKARATSPKSSPKRKRTKSPTRKSSPPPSTSPIKHIEEESRRPKKGKKKKKKVRKLSPK